MFRSNPSTTERKPRAPVCRLIALSAIAFKASAVNSSFTFSNLNIASNCLMIAFFGSLKTLINSSRFSSDNAVITGKRPTNSGIIPNFTKSSGSTFLYLSESVNLSSLPYTSAPKPMPAFFDTLFSTILSRPSKAPPQINKICEVSTSIFFS